MVKIGFMKILYAEFELREMSPKKLKRAKRLEQLRGTQKMLPDANAADEAVAVAGDDADAADGAGEMQGQTQKRGSDPAGEKCRITFEARQAVRGYFNGDAETGGEEPTSLILPSILVVKGACARLSNIRDDG